MTRLTTCALSFNLVFHFAPCRCVVTTKAAGPPVAMATVQYRALSDKDGEIIERIWKRPRDSYVRVGPEGYLFPAVFSETYHGFKNFELRSDDVWVVSFPKTGTTWTQELTWCLLNDLNLEKAKSVFSTERVPFIDIDFILTEEDRQIMTESLKESHKFATGIWIRENMCQFAGGLPSPRCLKSHLPFSLLPKDILKKSKVIYITRNVKDVVVSYFYHTVALERFEGTIEEFFELFMADLTMWDPFTAHVKEAWKLKDNPNLLFLFYEDLKKDLGKELDKVAKFLGKQITPEQKAALLSHLHIDSFKKNSSINFDEEMKKGIHNGDFIRKGAVGDHKEKLTEEMTRQLDEYIKREFDGTGLPLN